MKRILCWVTFAVTLVLMAGEPAHAQANATIGSSLTGFVPAAGGGYVRVEQLLAQNAGQRIWGIATGGALSVADTIAVAGPAGALTVTATTGVTLAEGAAAVGRCLAGAVPICAVGGAAYLAYSAYRAFHPSQVPGSTVTAGLLDYDPGKDPTVGANTYRFASSVWTYPQYVGAQYYDSPQALADSWGQKKVAAGYATECHQYSLGPTANQFNVGETGGPTMQCTGGTQGNQYVSVQSTRLADGPGPSTCSASTDPQNPAYNVPAGAPVGIDGKCPTARYNHVPFTPAQAADVIALNPPPAGTWNPTAGTGSPTGSQFPHAVSDAVDKGLPAQTVKGTPQSTTGPASQTGTPTSTTTNNGGTSSTSTQTPTYNYTYGPTTITVQNSNVTVNGGTTTTTTGPDAKPPPTDCDKYPDDVACTKLGAPPVAENLPNTDTPITYAPTAFTSSAGCPAPPTIAFNIAGQSKSYTISYTPLCDLMTTMAPIFTALFAAAAALIFMDGIKSI